MNTARILVLAAAFLATGVEAATAQPAPNQITLHMPRIPEPARIALDAKTTAIVVLDFVEPICGSQANCSGQMLPAAASTDLRRPNADWLAGIEIELNSGCTVSRFKNISPWHADDAPHRPPAQ